MAFAVTDFKTQLATGGGGARPSLYTVDINGPITGLSFSGSSNILVKAAAIPASTIAPLTTNYMGRAYKTPGFRTFDVWNVTVINDEDMAARSNIISWMRRIGGSLEGNRSTFLGGKVPDSSEGDATVTQMGKDGLPKQSWKIFQMWPTELGEIALDWSSDAIQEYTVAFAYDYWSHGDSATPPAASATTAPIKFTA
jgi:hypothetical protein